MNYQKAMNHVLANPDLELFAVELIGDFLQVYKITNPEDDNYVSIMYEGGKFFESEGEDEVYEDEDLPDSVRNLTFYNIGEKSSELFLDLVAEYSMFRLFPSLPEPELLYSRVQKKNFITLAKKSLVKAKSTIWKS